jgi:hypothetical protein
MSAQAARAESNEHFAARVRLQKGEAATVQYDGNIRVADERDGAEQNAGIPGIGNDFRERSTY